MSTPDRAIIEPYAAEIATGIYCPAINLNGVVYMCSRYGYFEDKQVAEDRVLEDLRKMLVGLEGEFRFWNYEKYEV